VPVKPNIAVAAIGTTVDNAIVPISCNDGYCQSFIEGSSGKRYFLQAYPAIDPIKGDIICFIYTYIY
jgi:hypothetical protein